MNAMRVVYIDEKEIEFDYFLRSAVASKAFEENDIVPIPLKSNIEDMLEGIFSEKVDGLVFDYNLGEDDSGIDYTGLDLLKQIRRQRQGFPCVVITSFLPQALEEKESSWRIIDKEKVFSIIKGGRDDPNNFFKRLRNEIEVFKQKIDDDMEECSRLYDKIIKGDINATEYQEFLDKSAFLESAMIGDGALPRHLLEAENPFLKLIEKANEIIAKIEATENESDV